MRSRMADSFAPSASSSSPITGLFDLGFTPTAAKDCLGDLGVPNAAVLVDLCDALAAFFGSALTRDQALAIVMLVCVPDAGGGESLFARVNRALRERGDDDLPRWRDFLCHVLCGLRSLPVVRGTVFRACPGAPPAALAPGAVFRWDAFASVSTSEQTVSQFASSSCRADGATLFRIALDGGPGARSIESISPFGSRLREAIIEPGCEFEVRSVSPLGTGVTVVSLAQLRVRQLLVDEEARTLEATDAADARRLRDAHDLVSAAICICPSFSPALLLHSALRLQAPSLFRPDDIGARDALARAKEAASSAPERRARALAFLARISGAQQSPTRQLVLALWLIAVDGNAAQAIRPLRVAADLGGAAAQHALGVCLRDGDGTARDSAAAAALFAKAAEQGHADAQACLALCLDAGIGVQRNSADAIGWCRKAAESGHVGAQMNLAACLMEGRGGQQSDRAEAVKFLWMAADQGNPDAKRLLLEEVGSRAATPPVSPTKKKKTTPKKPSPTEARQDDLRKQLQQIEQATMMLALKRFNNLHPPALPPPPSASQQQQQS